MNSWLVGDGYHEIAESLLRNRSSYTPHRLMHLIQMRHDRLCADYIDPVYVFPGAKNPAQIVTAKEQAARTYVQQLCEEAKHKKIKMRDHRRDFNSKLRLTQLIDPGMVHFLGQWMREQGNMEVVNAPFETTWQLLEMERTYDTQGSISDDGTLAMAGSKLVLFGANYAPHGVEARVFERLKDVEQKARKYDLSTNSKFLPEAATLYGTRYWERKKDAGKIAIRHRWPQLVESIKKGETPINPSFNIATNQLRYGPVARVTKDGLCTIEPLHKLPDGALSWEELLGFDPIKHLTISTEDYAKARSFDDNLSFALSTSTREGWLQYLSCEESSVDTRFDSDDDEEEKEESAW